MGGDDGDPEDGRQHVLAEARQTEGPLPDDLADAHHRLADDHQCQRDDEAGQAIDLGGDVQAEQHEQHEAGGVVGGQRHVDGERDAEPRHGDEGDDRSRDEPGPDPDWAPRQHQAERPEAQRRQQGDVAHEQQEVGEVPVHRDGGAGDSEIRRASGW